MRRAAGLLAATALAAGCGGPLGTAPIVLTEVPNRPSGQALIVRAAERSGCQVTPAGEGGLLLRCPEGELHLPTFAGPPTFAVRCLSGPLAEIGRCRAFVRGMLLATEEPR